MAVAAKAGILCLHPCGGVGAAVASCLPSAVRDTRCAGCRQPAARMVSGVLCENLGLGTFVQYVTTEGLTLLPSPLEWSGARL